MTEPHTERWEFADQGSTATGGPDAVAELRRRIGAGRLENWLHSSRGRQLAVVCNGERAMVMLLDGPGDPGGHAVDPGADGWSDGYLLANGQHDEYPDEDTVPLDRALRLVRHLLDTGAPPPGTPWSADH
ncbi:Imm1 family immunity protein [Kitasatospora griseola]|uniref:Imm1 family immunity protein n=1 Tax=Kitasatospora griseola TaxID=2064 RepID=UPI0038022A54